jgi:hypothetical protein
MSKNPYRFVFASLAAPMALAATMLVSPTAHAGIEACGNIHVEANAECEISVEGGCEAQCEAVSFEAACAAEGYVSCEGECSVDATVDCQTMCTGGCEADCELDPPSFSCTAQCQADCEGGCDASCNDDECRASCEATCSAECDASCQVEPGEADCQVQCEQCCSGSCTAEANLDCQIGCQADLRAECVVDLEGGCVVECESPEGALFCDGEYVDHGGNLDECVSSLIALLDIHVEGYAEAECSGNSCEAEAGFSCAASIHPERQNPIGFLGFLLGTGLLVGFTRRRG